MCLCHMEGTTPKPKAGEGMGTNVDPLLGAIWKVGIRRATETTTSKTSAHDLRTPLQAMQILLNHPNTS